MAQAFDRVTARRFTRLAQVGALGALLSGVAVAAFLVPAATTPRVNLPEPDAAAGDAQAAGAAALPPIDSAGVAERLALIQNSPRPVDNPEAPAADGPDHPEGAHHPVVRYLGPVGAGNIVLMALIDDDGHQRFAGVGDHTAAGSVRSISLAELLLVDPAGKELKIALLDRGADTVTRTGAGRGSTPTRFGSGAAGINPPAAYAKPADGPNYGPEYEARKGHLIGMNIEKLRGAGSDLSEADLKREAERMADEALRVPTVGTNVPPPSPQRQKDIAHNGKPGQPGKAHP